MDVESIEIAPETADDRDAVFRVNALAFGREAEAQLVEALQLRGRVHLSLVAHRAGQVVGHALFSPVTIEDGSGEGCPGAGLGPVAVLPDLQGQRIGSRLIEAGLEMLKAEGVPFCVVLGHAAYYPRFGFESSSRFNVRCQWNVPEDAFMAIELQTGALANCAGIARYDSAFDGV